MNEQWGWCHDTLHGFGYSKNPDLYNQGEYPPHIWLGDLESLLGITSFDGLNFDETYDKLQPLIEARLEKRRKYLEEHPTKPCTHISIPKVNREYPPL
jgi:hypothetical protein